MDLLELYTHSFVIKIWLEEAPEEGIGALWRGQITHVGSNQRKYFQELKDLVLFIWPYLEEMGVKDGQARRLLELLEQTRPEPLEVRGEQTASREER